MIEGMASHGVWCNMRTYPMTCRFCGERVYYFTCDHNCRVFFDELGPPWPEHNCMERWIAELGPDTFGQLMAWRMMEPGVSIGTTIAPNHGNQLRSRAQALDRIEPMACEPRDGDVVEEMGIAVEVCEVVNLAKQLRIPADTPMGDSLLRALGTGELSRITIHTGSLEEDETWSFTFYVPQSLLRKRSVVRGDLVSCKLRARGIPGLPYVWVCDELAGGW